MSLPIDTSVKHPAPFREDHIEAILMMLRGLPVKRVLDPFAGIGTIHALRTHGYETYGVEKEEEWATQSPFTLTGNTLELPKVLMGYNIPPRFDAIATSPSFGNRMCFVADTMVLTHRGHVPIKEVVEGDMVFTHRRRWKRVLSSGPSGVKRVVKVLGRGPGEIVCTPDHRFLVSENIAPGWDGKIALDTPRWKEVGSSVGDYWVMPRGGEGLEIPPMPDEDRIIFNEDFWWSVGLWLGDGWGYNTTKENGKWSRAYVSWCASQDEMPETEDRLKRCYGKYLTDPKFDAESVGKVGFYSQGLLRWLYEHFGRGASGKTIPGWVLSLSHSHREALVEGYMRADGHEVKDREGNQIIVSVSKPLLLGAQSLAHSLGWTASLTQWKPERDEWVVGQMSHCKPTWRLSIYRRESKMAHEVDGFTASLIRSVEFFGAEMVYDLEVEDDHSFIANGVVVHNSDHHEAKDKSKRHTYRHYLGRKIMGVSSATMNWGNPYREFHREAWEIVTETTQAKFFILNIKDHIRGGVVIEVKEFHETVLRSLGWGVDAQLRMDSPGQRHGRNGESRVDHEWMLRFRRDG